MRRLAGPSRLSLLALAGLVGGCEGVQSVLAPAGADALAIARLSWVLFIGGGAILALVIGLTAYAMLVPQARRRWAASHGFIIGGGIVFPVVALTALLSYGLLLTGRVGRTAETPALRIDVTGEQFWWRVRYHLPGGGTFDGANEIHLPVGQPVELALRSADVIHSFWVPSLAGKLDMIPGQENRLAIRANVPGTYRGQCAEYCGVQHTQMAFHAVAHDAEAFTRWLEDRVRTAVAEPQEGLARQGRDLFLSAGCGACHTVRGTPANGVIGPDLTHVGSRQSIGAGLLPNAPDALAAWIGSSQHLKPGNRMPSFTILSGDQLAAIAAYLESLK